MMENQSPWAQLQNGHPFDFLSPNPELIDIENIASSLSKICRFSGQVNFFYSVAEHSWLLANYFAGLGSIDLAKFALLHDAKEAYIGDISSPVKALIGVDGKLNLKEAETKIDAAIFAKFGLPFVEMPNTVKVADNQILLNERDFFQQEKERDWIQDVKGVKPLQNISFHCWEHPSARIHFLRMYHFLWD